MTPEQLNARGYLVWHCYLCCYRCVTGELASKHWDEEHSERDDIQDLADPTGQRSLFDTTWSSKL